MFYRRWCNFQSELDKPSYFSKTRQRGEYRLLERLLDQWQLSVSYFFGHVLLCCRSQCEGHEDGSSGRWILDLEYCDRSKFSSYYTHNQLLQLYQILKNINITHEMEGTFVWQNNVNFNVAIIMINLWSYGMWISR